MGHDSKNIMGRLLAPVIEKYTLVQGLGVFTLITLFLGGGTLFLFRANTVRTEAVSLNPTSVIILSIVFGLLFLFMGALFVASLTKSNLKDQGAVVVMVAFLEVVALAVMTYRTFTIVPLPAMLERRQEVSASLEERMKNLPEKVNDDLAITKIFYRGRALVFFYNLKESRGAATDTTALHDKLAAISCRDYGELYKSRAINTIIHEFFVNNSLKYTVSIRDEECHKGTP